MLHFRPGLWCSYQQAHSKAFSILRARKGFSTTRDMNHHQWNTSRSKLASLESIQPLRPRSNLPKMITPQHTESSGLSSSKQTHLAPKSAIGPTNDLSRLVVTCTYRPVTDFPTERRSTARTSSRLQTDMSSTLLEDNPSLLL